MARTDGRDIVEVLREDHATLRSMIGSARSGMSEGPAAPLLELRDLILRHEIAEDLIVNPCLLHSADGATVVESQLQEQTDIEQLLVHLDHQIWATPEFERGVTRLVDEFLAHLEIEESEVLPVLAARLNRRRRVDLGRRFIGVMELCPLPQVPPNARPPSGPTIVDHTAALSVWIRDVAAASGLTDRELPATPSARTRRDDGGWPGTGAGPRPAGAGGQRCPGLGEAGGARSTVPHV